MEKWGKWDWETWENCPELSHFSPILLLPFPTNFTHFFYSPHNVFLAISHNSPNSPISPPFPPISPHFSIFPIFLHLCGVLANSAAANADAYKRTNGPLRCQWFTATMW